MIKCKKKTIQQTMKNSIIDFELKSEITPTCYKICENLWVTFVGKANFKVGN